MSILAPANPVAVEEVQRKLDALDLSKIHLNLQDTVDGPGWTAEQCLQVENRYRAMLAGRMLYPNIVFAPDKELDVFWHYHILDTRAYIADCDALFGAYLHHDPYLGMEGQESEEALMRAWTATQELYQLLGTAERPLANAAFCGMGDKAAFCGMGDEPASAAFCGMGDGPAPNTAAFCGMGDGDAPAT